MDNERFHKVKDAPGFVKDTVSKAILNTDTGALQAYKRQKKALLASQENTERLNKVEEDVRDIKDLLQQILGKLDR